MASYVRPSHTSDPSDLRRRLARVRPRRCVSADLGRSFAIVFQEIHGFNAGQLGLSFMGKSNNARVEPDLLQASSSARLSVSPSSSGGSAIATSGPSSERAAA